MRDLGDLTPVRGVVEWLDDQSKSVAAPPESVRLLAEVRKKLTDALADAAHADLEEGLTPAEYAALTVKKLDTIYKKIQRNQLPVKRQGRKGVRILVDDAA